MVFDTVRMNHKSCVMFSMIFFIFVALVVIFGFLAVRWRRNNRRRNTYISDKNALNKEEVRESRIRGTFNETPTGDIKGGVLPADNKLSQNDFNEEDEVIK